MKTLNNKDLRAKNNILENYLRIYNMSQKIRSMKFTLAVMAMWAMPASICAEENMSGVLESIEANNTTLSALRQSAEAEKIGNRTDIYLPGPDVEFNYLWGNPGSIGNRTDIKATQTLDYATLSGRKSRVANAKNELADLQYKAQRIDIIREAKSLCLDIIYCNAMIRELETQRDMVRQMIAYEKKRLDSGEGSQVDYNSAKLAEVPIIGEYTKLLAQRDTYLATLTGLNGGKEITLTQAEFPAIALPDDFESWYMDAARQNPLLAYAAQDIAVNEENVKLEKAMNVPSLTAGFMSEHTTAETFRGITLGLSIPLWSNKNKVKAAKAEVLAAQLRAEDAKHQFYAGLQTLYRKTSGLKSATEAYREALADPNNAPLLQKALEAGKITVIDFIAERNSYYSARIEALATELEYQKAYVELTSVY